MNNFVSKLVLSTTLLIPMFAEAATFILGSFPGGTGFSDADLNSGSNPPRNQLPSNGPFSDDWNFTVGVNTGGSSNVSITGINDLNLSGLSAVLLGAGGFSASYLPLFSNTSNELIGLTFGTLNTGSYSIRITGNTTGTTTDSHSYSGNLTIGNDPVATPIPGALLLFGSAILSLVGISSRHKRTN